jgi:hypothetical protein
MTFVNQYHRKRLYLSRRRSNQKALQHLCALGDILQSVLWALLMGLILVSFGLGIYGLSDGMDDLLHESKLLPTPYQRAQAVKVLPSPYQGEAVVGDARSRTNAGGVRLGHVYRRGGAFHEVV